MTQAIAPFLDPADRSGAADPPLDFAGLLGSRICHDLISPVGAIGNGLELLAELGRGGAAPAAGGPELELIGASARSASDTLQFYRLAFGAASAAEETSSLAARRVLMGWVAHHKVSADWRPGAEAMPRAAARLLCNLAQCAVSVLPRGGRIAILEDAAADALAVEASGASLALPGSAGAWLSAAPGAPPPSPREVHFVAAARHAAEAGARVVLTMAEDSIRLETRPL
ncbi:MAG: histidine phosphotransferase family protein [Pseudomonadota bacterium]